MTTNNNIIIFYGNRFCCNRDNRLVEMDGNSVERRYFYNAPRKNCAGWFFFCSPGKTLCINANREIESAEETVYKG